MHDLLFLFQGQINASNIDQKLKEFARSIKSLSEVEFASCIENEMSLGLVYRDLNLAEAKSVKATPTIFINGRRFLGFKDASELREAISDAKTGYGGGPIK